MIMFFWNITHIALLPNLFSLLYFRILGRCGGQPKDVTHPTNRLLHQTKITPLNITKNRSKKYDLLYEIIFLAHVKFNGYLLF